jgi:hypothetical protein
MTAYFLIMTVVGVLGWLVATFALDEEEPGASRDVQQPVHSRRASDQGARRGTPRLWRPPVSNVRSARNSAIGHVRHAPLTASMRSEVR